MIKLHISELPPTVNGMYRNLRGKGRVKTTQYLRWCKSAGWEVKSQLPSQTPITTKQYGLIVSVHKRNNADLSNYMKPIEDLLVGLGVTPDDQHNIFPLPIYNEGGGVDIIIIDSVEAKLAREVIRNFTDSLI